MKTYSIGRDPSCNIVINDPSNVVSRRHAILNVSSNGKMTITDLSVNGTYVNGIRITSNVEVPVTRKDIISFAHVSQFDWNIIPHSKNTRMYIIYAVAAFIVAGGAYLFINNTSTDYTDINRETETVVVDSLKKESEPVDSTKVKKKETEEKKDSVENPKTAPKNKKDKKDQKNKDNKKTDGDSKKTEEEKNKNTDNRILG